MRLDCNFLTLFAHLCITYLNKVLQRFYSLTLLFKFQEVKQGKQGEGKCNVMLSLMLSQFKL